MSYFEYNAANTIGYSVAMRGHGVVTLHAHSQKADLSFYEKFGAYYNGGSWLAWVYMPVDDDEYITEIGRRVVISRCGRELSLTVRRATQVDFIRSFLERIYVR
jgi:hypothetical protein